MPLLFDVSFCAVSSVDVIHAGQHMAWLYEYLLISCCMPGAYFILLNLILVITIGVILYIIFELKQLKFRELSHWTKVIKLISGDVRSFWLQPVVFPVHRDTPGILLLYFNLCIDTNYIYTFRCLNSKQRNIHILHHEDNCLGMRT